MQAIPLSTPEALLQTAKRGHLKGRQPDPVVRESVRGLIGPRPAEGYRRDLLIEYLHLINDACKGLPEAWLVALATEMSIPMVEVFEVASFYHHFEVLKDSTEPPAQTIRVCNSLSCKMAGADELLQSLPDLLGQGVRVLPAPCLGRCEQAPAVQVGQQAVSKATVQSVIQASQGALRHAPSAKFAPEVIAYEAYRAGGGYGLAASIVSGEQSLDAALERMDQAGLRGLGGAGFPAGRKWRIVRDQPAPRLMAVNIDEGEPGTFKDRFYLERDPHRFLEGMLISAHVVGCESIYIYLRDEYHDCRALLKRELVALQANPPFPLPHIELRRGAGAYICGEESAMIESIEGKRGEPRLRPPYIAQTGLFGRPTLEHNFETLYWVRDILTHDDGWFAEHGRHGRKGFRSFSVSGRVKNPGVKLAPAGITLRELIDEHCDGMADGQTLYAYLPGGASGGIFPASLADVPLDFDTLQPHGGFIGSAAVVVLSQADKARDAALNVMQFFAGESCGQCTPCRVGTVKAAQLMKAAVWDVHTLEDLSQVMTDASICGLGQAAPNPVRCVIKYFAHEVGL